MTFLSNIRMKCTEYDMNWKYGKLTIPNVDETGAKKPVNASVIWRGGSDYNDRPFGLIQLIVID